MLWVEGAWNDMVYLIKRTMFPAATSTPAMTSTAGKDTKGIRLSP